MLKAVDLTEVHFGHTAIEMTAKFYNKIQELYLKNTPPPHPTLWVYEC